MNQSIGFDWGFKPTLISSSNSSTPILTPTVTSNVADKINNQKLKRTLTNDDIPTYHLNNGTYKNSHNFHKVHKIRKKPSTFHHNFIQGQPLPLSRSIELMNKQGLEDILIELVRLHPEIQENLVAMMPVNHDFDQYLSSLKKKLEKIYENIPYSRNETLNDYAFVRMKTSILEFFDCLIDYLLNSLPPQSTNVIQALKFLDISTSLVYQVPNFQTVSNNYYKTVCYEQLNEIWISLIRYCSTDAPFMSIKSNLVNWYNVLYKHNSLTNGKLMKSQQFCKSLLFEQEGENNTTTTHQQPQIGNVV